MEEKKLDINSIIGFLLIFGILIFWFYTKQPTPEELEAEKARQEQVEAEQKDAEATPVKPILTDTKVDLQDSTALANYKNSVGDFGFTKASDE
ncbi:MAG: membrane protein insertase YidC, partial [Flavobacteriaceae bacterium]